MAPFRDDSARTRGIGARNAPCLSLAGKQSGRPVGHDSATVSYEDLLCELEGGPHLIPPLEPKRHRSDTERRGNSHGCQHREQRQKGAPRTPSNRHIDALRAARFTFSSWSLPPTCVGDAMGEFSLAPFWALLKIQLDRLINTPRRRCGVPGFTRFWQLAQMEFNASIQGPSLGRVVRCHGIFSPPPDRD